MDHLLRCKCGTVKGVVTRTEKVSRGVCYCRDCQAYAHALGNPGEMLDELGGSDLITTLQQNVIFHKGIGSLACMSLTEHGLLRWYASCCKTPIGNTPRKREVSFVGLLHNCLEHGACPVDSAFGPVRMRVNTNHAKGKVPPMRLDALTSAASFFWSIAKARVTGSYKQSPFFVAESDTPIASPRVLSAVERERAMSAV